MWCGDGILTKRYAVSRYWREGVLVSWYSREEVRGDRVKWRRGTDFVVILRSGRRCRGKMRKRYEVSGYSFLWRGTRYRGNTRKRYAVWCYSDEGVYGNEVFLNGYGKNGYEQKTKKDSPSPAETLGSPFWETTFLKWTQASWHESLHTHFVI